jgi:hypothetical protein
MRRRSGRTGAERLFDLAYIVFHHLDVSPGRAVRVRKRIGIEPAADLGAGLPGDLLDQARIGDVFQEDRRNLLAFICRMMRATSLAEASASVETPCGAMKSMP